MYLKSYYTHMVQKEDGFGMFWTINQRLGAVYAMMTGSELSFGGGCTLFDWGSTVPLANKFGPLADMASG